MNPNNIALSNADFIRLYETAIKRMEAKWETKFAQLTADMNRGFRNVPVAVSNHMYLKSGEHCKCCSQLKKLQRSNSKASIQKPLAVESAEHLQDQLRRAIAHYKDNGLVEKIDAMMIIFGSRSIETRKENKIEDFEIVTEAYLKSISSEDCSDEDITARATESYNHVHSLCKHFVVAYLGDKLLTHFTWSSLDAKVRKEMTALFECIVLFWNKRVGISGFPTTFAAEMISDAEAHTPVMPLYRADKNWMARRMLISAIQTAVPDKPVRRPVSSGVSNNFDSLGLSEEPLGNTSTFNVSMSTLSSFGRVRMPDDDAPSVSSGRDILNCLSDDVFDDVLDEVSEEMPEEVPEEVSEEVSGAKRQLANSNAEGERRKSQRSRNA
ncbi:uncharacterized protein EV154DRAFT_567500 [Mucor mucedo]|uniref:uncharacterized protein n=1 Tax=Mucor mucedo TaxID=29922 RepID=UPI002220C7AD|nr:uncharacterized protein EV154DRAFT_567500 [Mucor mucedo]KAI7887065.1 hypothetical protein EV154DRAFT_567500 [Mucor mucedo]